MIDFLRNSAGFFIQLFPCILLFLVSLNEDGLRFCRKQIILFFLLINIVLSLLFPYIMQYVVQLNITPELFGNFYMLFVVVIMLILFQFISNEALIKKLLIICFILFYATIQYFVANCLITIVSNNANLMANEVYGPFAFWVFFLETIIMLPPSYLFMVKIVRPHLAESSIFDLKREFKFIIIVTLFYFGLLIIIMSILYNGPWGNNIAILITVSSLICICALSLNLWILFHEMRRVREESMIKNQMTIQEIQYQKINKEIENAKRTRHDIRHHMRTLQTLIEKGDSDMALGYIYKITKNTQSLDEQEYCENFTINTLLCYYINWAKSENIVCNVIAKCGDVPIDAPDLTILLGNCLENAILSCREVDNKKLILKIGVVGTTFAVELTNSCKEVHLIGSRQNDNDFLPINSFTSLRSSGYGLKSIENTVYKYDGTVRCRYDKIKHEFTTRIILNFK